MDVLVASLLNGALVVVSAALLVSLCVRCGRRTSIHQSPDVRINEYPSDVTFRVVRPTQTVSPAIYNQGYTQNQLFPTSPQQDPNRRYSFTPTNDGGSIQSYENPGPDLDDDYVNDKEDDPDEGPGYIKVLPDNPPAVTDRMSQQSLLSGNEDYVNVDDQSGQSEQSADEQSDNENYINMPEQSKHRVTQGISYESVESEGNDSADYVNTSVIVN